MRKIITGLVLLAALIAVVSYADTVTAYAGTFGEWAVAVAVAILGAAFLLLVVLPLLGLMVAGITFIILLLLLVAVIAVPFAMIFGNDSGPAHEQAGDLAPFHKVHVKGNMMILVQGGDTSHIAMKGSSDDIRNLVLTNKDGILTLAPGDKMDFTNPLQVALGTKILDEFSVEGAVRASLQDITAAHFELGVTGAGQVQAVGMCGTATIHLSGAGALDTSALKCDDVTVQVDGAGNARVFAAQKLEATVNGIGRVEYEGNPPKIVRHITGLGVIAVE